MFNNEKIKKLEEDIRFLYKLYENLHEKTESDKIFNSFCINRQQVERSRLMESIYYPLPEIEPEWKDISVKTVVDMILKKMGLKVEYIPEKVEAITPAEFKLVKKE